MDQRSDLNEFEPYVDLLASVLFIVILALLASLLQNESAAADVKEARRVLGLQVGVRKELAADLADNLGVLVYVDKETGLISIGEEALTFERNSARINRDGRKLLRNLADPLGQVVFSSKYRPHLRKIVVEGHTDQTRAARDPYFNWSLSSDRALAVVTYLIANSGPAKNDYERYLEATGMADRHLVYGPSGRPDTARSRRIEIRVVLDDKELVDRLAGELGEVLRARSKESE